MLDFFRDKTLMLTILLIGNFYPSFRQELRGFREVRQITQGHGPSEL